jgi:hypothetical protein
VRFGCLLLTICSIKLSLIIFMLKFLSHRKYGVFFKEREVNAVQINAQFLVLRITWSPWIRCVSGVQTYYNAEYVVNRPIVTTLLPTLKALNWNFLPWTTVGNEANYCNFNCISFHYFRFNSFPVILRFICTHVFYCFHFSISRSLCYVRSL